MKQKKELLKNTIIIFIGKFSTQFLTLIMLPLYTTYLSTSEYGIVDLIITYVALLTPVITLQQEMAVFRQLIDSRNDDKKIKKVISTAFKSLGLTITLFLLLYIFIILFINFKYKYLIIINILSCIFSNLFLQIARGLGKNNNYAIASFLTGIITISSNILLIIFLGFGAEGMLISMILANIICVVYLFISLKLYKYISFNEYDKTLNKEMIKYSWPLVPNGISWWVINASDRTIISIFLGVAANGIYAVSNKFSTIISSLFSIFSMSWTESASLHINDDDRDQFFSDIANTIIGLFSTLCIGLISVMPFVFSILIGSEFSEAYNYIPIFMVASLCSCVVGIYSAIYVAKKMTKKVAMTSIMSAIINITFNVIFINFIGLYAACISTAVAYFIMMIYRHFDLKKYVNINYNKKNIFLIIIVFIVASYVYYIDNIYLHSANFLLFIAYAFILNKELLFNFINTVKQKVLLKRTKV